MSFVFVKNDHVEIILQMILLVYLAYMTDAVYSATVLCRGSVTGFVVLHYLLLSYI
jgi:hypothetical protein